MEIIVGWIVLSVGFVMGATWRGISEKQSRRRLAPVEDKGALVRLPGSAQTWQRKTTPLGMQSHRHAS